MKILFFNNKSKEHYLTKESKENKMLKVFSVTHLSMYKWNERWLHFQLHFSNSFTFVKWKKYQMFIFLFSSEYLWKKLHSSKVLCWHFTFGFLLKIKSVSWTEHVIRVIYISRFSNKKTCLNVFIWIDVKKITHINILLAVTDNHIFKTILKSIILYKIYFFI